MPHNPNPHSQPGSGKPHDPAPHSQPGSSEPQDPTPLSHPVFGEPTFAEGQPSPDPAGFEVLHASDNQVYKQIQDLLKKQVVPVPPARGKPDDLYTLADALGPGGQKAADQITKAGHIVFHSMGDSGASDVRKYKSEIRVSDQVVSECRNLAPEDRPAFLYHLGDVVYSFGESKYYYDQFYEPFRNYPRPILAIPGNHDSFVIPGTPAAQTPLATFQRNFCSEQSAITPEAASLHRTAMTQPGVYFTLDAPFVRIIGLFSNALEDPGVISAEGSRWPAVTNVQLEYLEAQLDRIVKENYKGAVLIAVHHPPFSYSPPKANHEPGGNHGSSTEMLREIDTICAKKKVYPHAFLSAHAHNYQRYTRTVRFGGKEFDVPFIVCGDGGHNVNPLMKGTHGHPAQEPQYGTDVKYLDPKPAVDTGGLLLEKYNDMDYGYLRISVDKTQLRIGYHEAGNNNVHQSQFDLVTVDLESHTMVSN